jgi:RHS repeat-associated protein
MASLTGTNQTNTGNLFLPKTAESYTYDADGNLTSDGRWTNRWDGENRLIDMTSHASGPSGSRKSLQFAYDSQSRRYSKTVSNWTGSAWVRVLDERYVYDRWNLLAALNGTNAAIVRSFLWGLDLSGSLQGAGGVGGLICFRQHSGSQAATHFAAYDGNGNVMGLVDSGGNTSARYDYDPFGQTVRASGAAATINPVRFSSKCVDEESDFTYFGFRYLSNGRWPNRDPLGESESINLFSFVENDAPNTFDSWGFQKGGGGGSGGANRGSAGTGAPTKGGPFNNQPQRNTHYSHEFHPPDPIFDGLRVLREFIPELIIFTFPPKTEPKPLPYPFDMPLCPLNLKRNVPPPLPPSPPPVIPYKLQIPSRILRENILV